MPWGRSTGEKDKEQAQEERAQGRKLAEFMASPAGEAFQARRAGEPFFLLQLDLVTLSGKSSMGSSSTRLRRQTGTPGTLAAVEQVGWRLEHANWVYIETGSTSTNRVLHSGQGVTTRGKVVGMYLFREAEPSAEWAKAVAGGDLPEGWEELLADQ